MRWHRQATRTLVVLAAAYASVAGAQPPFPVHLVADVNATPLSSEPTALVRLGGRVLFTAQTRLEGRELWATDGAPGGTAIVRDILPGIGSGLATSGLLPTRLATPGGEIVLFAANDGVNGTELWRSDGTPAGTFLVRDINPGLAGSSPQSGFVRAGVLYFSADDGVHGRELWRTDGTDTGTELVFNFADDSTGQGPVGSNPQVLGFTSTGGMFVRSVGIVFVDPTGTQVTQVRTSGLYRDGYAVVNDALLFSYFDGNEQELWTSDGTIEGTRRLRDIAVGSGSSSPEAFFVARGVGPGGSDLLYFQAAGPGVGYELYKSDGTEAGTVLVKDIWPGTAGSSPRPFAQVGDKVLMWGSSGAGSTQLLVTDGTEAGTGVLANMVYGGIGSSAYTAVSNFFVEGGSAFFAARVTGSTAQEVYRVDPTPAGQPLAAPVQVTAAASPGIGSLAPAPWLGPGGLVMGGISPPVGTELLRNDAAGTTVLADLRTGTAGSDPGWLTAVGRRVVFAGRTAGLYGLFGADVDGGGAFEAIAPSAAISVQEPSPNSPSTPAVAMSPSGPVAVFQLSDSVTGAELWRTDGTAAGTALVMDLTPGPNSSTPVQFAAAAGRVVFLRQNTSPPEVWQTDGTAAGSTRLFQTSSVFPSASTPFVPIPGGFIWSGQPVGGVSGLQRTLVPSGTTARITTAGSPVWPGVASGPLVFYRGFNSSGGDEVWKTDGTDAGTGPAADVNPGPGGSVPQNLTPVGDGTVFFTAQSPVFGRELFFSDGTPTGTVLLADITPGLSGSTVNYSAATVGPDGVRRGFFVINGQLWVSDGTPVGTRVLSDLRPGSADNYQHLTAIAGRVYFTANDGVHGQEAWVTDGTPAGTRRLTDLCPGDCPSFALTGTRPNFTRVGSRLVLAADDGLAGAEVWAVDLCPGDFNNDGAVSVQDVFDFLQAYFRAEPHADVNGVGGVSVQDVFDWLGWFFAGC